MFKVVFTDDDGTVIDSFSFTEELENAKSEIPLSHPGFSMENPDDLEDALSWAMDGMDDMVMDALFRACERARRHYQKGGGD